MNTKDMAREQISAFADGEVAEGHVDVVMASLRQAEAAQDWDLYHQIGDVLRSNDMGFVMSPDFSARMAAALEQEPALIAPMQPKNGTEVGAGDNIRARRWALPGMAAAAAVAAAAFIATPQLMVAIKGTPAAGGTSLASAGKPHSASDPVIVKTAAPQGVVLRDARMDDYLLAHQRFSPSVFSTAQYARSATFANDSNK